MKFYVILLGLIGNGAVNKDDVFVVGKLESIAEVPANLCESNDIQFESNFKIIHSNTHEIKPDSIVKVVKCMHGYTHPYAAEFKKFDGEVTEGNWFIKLKQEDGKYMDTLSSSVWKDSHGNEFICPWNIAGQASINHLIEKIDYPENPIKTSTSKSLKNAYAKNPCYEIKVDEIHITQGFFWI